MRKVAEKQKIRAVIIIMTLLVVLSFAIREVAVTKASNVITVRVHYSRTNSDYDGWNLWMWTDNTSGAYYFTGTDSYGAYFDFKTDEQSINDIGFIIRKGEWEEKDYDSDRFIDVSTIYSGRIDVYLKQGRESIEYDYGNAVKGAKVKNISVKDKRTIVAELSMNSVTNVNSSFAILNENSKSLKISNISTSGTTVTIKMSSDLDYYSAHTLKYNDFAYSMNMPVEYSSDEFESRFTYDGDDLGSTWSKESTTFKVWAPTAGSVKVNLYESGTNGTNDLISTTDMVKGDKGVWSVTINGDIKNKYYTYSVNVGGNTRETIDPYAKASGINGERGMIIDLDSTDPEGWDKDTNPNKGTNYTDAIIYELHIKDFSYDSSSGIKNKGKYIAFAETGTTNNSGQKTGIDYLKDLGITHVHLLPTNDFSSGDESGYWDDYCWGYDPKNYNIPDGMYSTDPYDGNVRVNEYKQMVKSLHDNGISVVTDVVFNHVASTGDFSMNVIVPDYFIRPNSNGTGCGNDVATERSMVRKFIVDSIVYWAEEYHIDGFRFDLVGILDTQTINEIAEEVHKIDPSIILYGEGWDMYTNVTKPNISLAKQGNAGLTQKFAYFSDSMRDIVKGNNFDVAVGGYVNGGYVSANDFVKCLYGDPAWSWYPTQVINYVSCHDNYTLFDKLQATAPNASLGELVDMNNLSAAIVMTSQGVPLFQAGEEILRTKEKEDGTFEHNSYGSGCALNSIKYDVLNNDQYQRSYNYYKGLIEFRKQHSALRMTSYDDIYRYMSTMVDGNNNQGVVAYKISGDANNDISDGIIVAFNPSGWDYTLSLPEGSWKICVNKEKAGTDVLGTASGSVKLVSKSCLILVKGATTSVNKNVDSKITVHFKSEWDGANIYYWDTLPNYTSNTWPGDTMTSEGNSWYSYTIDNSTSANLIFNYGNKQTADLSQTEGEWWYMDGKWYDYNPEPTGITVHYYSKWGGANIYYWDTNPALPAVTWPGVAMTSEGGKWYTYTLTGVESANVIFNYNGNQTADLSRTTGEWWCKDGTWYNTKP